MPTVRRTPLRDRADLQGGTARSDGSRTFMNGACYEVDAVVCANARVKRSSVLGRGAEEADASPGWLGLDHSLGRRQATHVVPAPIGRDTDGAEREKGGEMSMVLLSAADDEKRVQSV